MRLKSAPWRWPPAAQSDVLRTYKLGEHGRVIQAVPGPIATAPAAAATYLLSPSHTGLWTAPLPEKCDATVPAMASLTTTTSTSLFFSWASASAAANTLTPLRQRT